MRDWENCTDRHLDSFCHKVWVSKTSNVNWIFCFCSQLPNKPINKGIMTSAIKYMRSITPNNLSSGSWARLCFLMSLQSPWNTMKIMINYTSACFIKIHLGEWTRKFGRAIGKYYPISNHGWSISKRMRITWTAITTMTLIMNWLVILKKKQMYTLPKKEEQ